MNEAMRMTCLFFNWWQPFTKNFWVGFLFPKRSVKNENSISKLLYLISGITLEENILLEKNSRLTEKSRVHQNEW